MNSFKTHFESELHLKKIQTEQGSMECPQQWKFYVQFLDQTLSRSIVVESNNRQIAQVRDSRTEYPLRVVRRLIAINHSIIYSPFDHVTDM